MASETSAQSVIGFLIWGVPFWIFVVIKATGVTFAAWSWWWVFLPQIPTLGLLVKRWGL